MGVGQFVESAMPTDMMPAGRERGGLVKQIGDELRTEIASGRFDIGDKLPSQAELSERFGVSRTVVREAIASLQADGLLEARQGAGVFITASTPPTAGAFQAVDVKRISSMLETLELRSAVEIEAAGLAALRRSPAQEEAILRAHQAVASQIAAGHRSAETDFAFHRAIAAATNNPRFVEFLDLLGQSAIPRTVMQPASGDPPPTPNLEKIAEEHRAIVHAIASADETAAREAMRVHLKGSQQRYRRLIQGESP
jgi:GntR family transcriptional repressor for pyruvate dehydrogenase complex